MKDATYKKLLQAQALLKEVERDLAAELRDNTKRRPLDKLTVEYGGVAAVVAALDTVV